MITFSNYVKAKSLEEAYELNQKKGNAVIGGMLWMKMSKKRFNTIIDLSQLGLDKIEETDDEFRIGCMVTLRDIEQHKSFNEYTCGAACESVRHIVGVQFRNLATVGGSIFGRYGFSDVLTMFMALESYVELYKGGIVPISEFAAMKYDRDILVRIIVKKTPISVNYQSVRNAKTDFPVLTCAVSKLGESVKAVIGARPMKACVVEDSQGFFKDGINDDAVKAFAEYAAENITVGSNLRGSAEYRKQLAGVLVRRACAQIK